jgi:uncharacterized lipoprotein NlpE involved in copper resistance
MVVLVIFGLGSCLSSKGANETKNAKNNLDWEGVYTSTVLLNNEYAADVCIKLNRDQRLEYNIEYVDKAYEPFNFITPFRWDDTGNIIMMDPMDAPVQYKVEKDKLIQLGSDNYVLKKVR